MCGLGHAGQTFMINCDVAIPQLLHFIVDTALDDVNVRLPALCFQCYVVFRYAANRAEDCCGHKK
jgi:hypothetical protein